MITRRVVSGSEIVSEIVEEEWVSFPGGELEGRRPRVLCPACRERLRREARQSRGQPAVSRGPAVCFQCYRVDQARERALRAARDLCTASEARFQHTLPFEPIDRARLDRLRAERAVVRAGLAEGPDRFADRRRRAQIAARHALQQIAEGLATRGADQSAAFDAAVRAAELQLPEAWLPFVVSR